MSETKNWPALAVYLLALLVCVACARLPTAAHLYAIGETAAVDGWRVTVHSFSLLPGDVWRQPQEGQFFCVVELTLENASNKIRFVMPEKQMLLESASRTYGPDSMTTVLAARQRGWMVPEGQMSVGQRAHGAASYQIPIGAQDVRWTFRSNLFPWSPRVTFSLGALPRQ